MNPEEFRQRINKLLAEEAKNPLGSWYLSYAKESGFCGGVYIEAHGPTEAAYLSNKRGYSPGGELLTIGPLPPDKCPDRKYFNRLLTKEEIRAANPDDEWKEIAEFEAEENNG